MKRHLVFYTTFNQWLPNKEAWEAKWKIHPALTKRWIELRFNTFRKTALQSLMRQTMGDFHYVILCHRQSKAICDRLFRFNDKRIKVFYTDAECKAWMTSELSYCDEILAVRLDSDDMYRHDVADTVYKWAETSRKKFAYWPHGYACDRGRGLLWVYETRSSGPFYVHRWKINDLIAHGRIKDKYWHGAIKKLGAIALPGRMFCVTINHGRNESTRYNRKRFVQIVPVGDRWEIVMSRFGVLQ